MSTTTTTIPDSIEETIRETAENLSDRVRPHIDEGRRRLELLNDRARSLINEHPAACLLGALALGYFAARLARRERS